MVQSLARTQIFFFNHVVHNIGYIFVSLVFPNSAEMRIEFQKLSNSAEMLIEFQKLSRFYFHEYVM